MNDRNLVRHEGRVSRADRETLLAQRGCIVWLTGLSGSGKSTIASELEWRLVDQGRLAWVLDGDNVRHGLNEDLGFSDRDRKENIRRVGEVALLVAETGAIVITSLISPFREERDLVRARAGEGRFFEVFVDTPLDVCEKRDPKGLYRRARAGEIPEFTGISSPYEPPTRAEVVLRTAEMPVDTCVETVVALLTERGIVGRAG
jgi:adenylylsulfate kinase